MSLRLGVPPETRVATNGFHTKHNFPRPILREIRSVDLHSWRADYQLFANSDMASRSIQWASFKGSKNLAQYSCANRYWQMISLKGLATQSDRRRSDRLWFYESGIHLLQSDLWAAFGFRNVAFLWRKLELAYGRFLKPELISGRTSTVGLP